MDLPSGDTPSAPPAAAPGRPAWIALAALVLVGLATTPFLWLRSYAPTLLSGGDGAIYILCAESLMAGEGYTFLGEPFIIRPPGFSVLIMPLLAVFGRDYSVLTLTVWLSGIAGLGAYFWYERTRLGIPVALATAAVLFLNPFFQLAANQIMSDVPAILALFACLLLERHGRRRPSLAGDLGLGVAIAAATYLRSVHFLLLPALTLARLCGFLTGRPASAERGSPREAPRYFVRRVLPVLAVTLLALLPWKLREDRVAPEGVAEFTRLHSYGVALLHTDPADPDSPPIDLAEVGERFRKRSKDIVGTVGSRLVSDKPSGPYTVLTLLALGALVAVLAVRRGTSDWFVFGTLFVISIYFGFMNRLMLPVYFILVPAVAQVVLWTLGKALPRRAAEAVTVVLLLGWAALDYDPHTAYKETMEKDYAAFLETRDLLAETFSEDEVISSSRAAHFCLELGRDVLSHSWPMGRVGEEGTLEFLERHGVVGVVLNKARRPDRRLTQALGGRLRIVKRIGPYTVARIAR